MATVAATSAGAEIVLTSLQAAVSTTYERVIDTFRRFDKDKSGRIDLNEFRKAIKDLGMDEAPTAIDAAFSVLDSDRSGVISFNELEALLRKRMDVVVRPSTQPILKPIPLSEVTLLKKDSFLARLKADKILHDVSFVEKAGESHKAFQKQDAQLAASRRQMEAMRSKAVVTSAAAVHNKALHARQMEEKEVMDGRASFARRLATEEAQEAKRQASVRQAVEHSPDAARQFRRSRHHSRKVLVQIQASRREQDITAQQVFEQGMSVHGARAMSMFQKRKADFRSKNEAYAERLLGARSKQDNMRKQDAMRRAAIVDRLQTRAARASAWLDSRAAEANDLAEKQTLRRAETASTGYARAAAETNRRHDLAQLAMSRSAGHLVGAREEARKARAQRSEEKSQSLAAFFQQRAHEDTQREARTRAIAVASARRIEELEEEKRKAEHELQARVRKAIHTMGHLAEVEWASSTTTRQLDEVRGLLTQADLA